MILSLSACRKSKAPSDLYDFLDDDYQVEQPQDNLLSEPEEDPNDKIINAYMDYIKSYVWVFYLDTSDIPADGDYDMYEWGSYYLYDFEADGTPELVMIVGTSTNSSTCLVFTYKDGAVMNIGSTPCAYGVGVMYIEGSPTIVLCEFHGEYENFTAVTLTMETLYVASNIAVLPEGSVPMEPTPIGSDYTGTLPTVPEDNGGNYGENYEGGYGSDYEENDAPYGVGEEWDNPPPEKHFINCAKWEYENTYDCSGMFVESFWIDESTYTAHATVILIVPHTYADERIQIETVSYYIQSEDRWYSPVIVDVVTYMVWNENILGIWEVVGEGLWGGTEHVVFELFSTEMGTAVCSYGIGTVDNTFGEVSYSEKYADGEYLIESPIVQFGIENCCPLSQGRTKHSFYLHPDAGVYYRSGASTNVFPQEMVKAATE